jgi:hypothetical protein
MEKTCAKIKKFGILLWSKYPLVTAIAKTEEKKLCSSQSGICIKELMTIFK